MANLDFEELKKKAAEAAGVIADKSATVAKLVAEKAAILAKKAKLTAEIAGDKEQLKKAEQALGKLYFEKYGNDPDPDFLQAVSEVSLCVEKIDAKKAELDELSKEEEAVEVEIIVEQGAEGEECCAGEEAATEEAPAEAETEAPDEEKTEE